MRLKYPKPDGTMAELILGDTPITIGRSSDADVPVLDERASRTHCGVRLWDGEYYIKDLKSKNGTYVNTDKVEMGKIRPGDKIRIGTFVIEVEDEQKPGTTTIMKSVEDSMGEGKGFKTMLREIVEDVEEAEKAQQPPTIPEDVAAMQTVVRKKVKTVIRKKPVSFTSDADDSADAEAPAAPDEAVAESAPAAERAAEPAAEPAA
ncbi:MAG: putative component of type VI protein secretion system, partial [Verrucomicrobiales bacterium]